jgi:hypothetical protein
VIEPVGPARLLEARLVHYEVVPKPLTAEDILPLVACLTPQERARLLRLIVRPAVADDAAAYRAIPPASDEFSTDTDPLSWDADGWETVG